MSGRMGHGETIAAGEAALGIECGSTRIKACLIDVDGRTLATGSHEWENAYVDGSWTYALDAVWSGVRDCYADLVASVERDYGVRPTSYRAIGISAMMHGYLAFDEQDRLLVPFRTWRNTSTGPAAEELSALLGCNIPMRWSVAHLFQAMLDGEPHVADVRYLTTLAGYLHGQLTGDRVLGIGDASGMFPVDPRTRDYDADLLARFDQRASALVPGMHLADLLPRVLIAGQPAGTLTPPGATLLDPTGSLEPGIPFCPPEGDAGTGMVATNAVSPRTANVSIGTSIFAMVVLDRRLSRPHPELDIVTTPAGDEVAMVHCNNGASEVGAWSEVFGEFATAIGVTIARDEVFAALLASALGGEADAGGVLAYNYLSGEPITETVEGRPLIIRTPGSRLTLGNLMRAQVYGVFATLSIGMRALAEEGVTVDAMLAHGGLFRTVGVATRMLAAALDVPVVVGEASGEGGAWGAAVLANYLVDGGSDSLGDYLSTRIFSGLETTTVRPEAADVLGFAAYLDRYTSGLPVERAAGRWS